MGMTSREIVRRTLDFDDPERVARSFGESDFVGVGNTVKTRATSWERVDEIRWERTDEWGNLWARVDDTSKGEVVRGVLESVDEIAAYTFPDYSNPTDFDRVREVRAEHPDKWLQGNIPGFAFNIARKLLRLDEYLVALLTEPEEVRVLHDKIDDMVEDMIRNYAAAGVDAVMFCEDWGTQQQTLVSPDLWHEEFFPRFKRLCGVARESGVRVFMHSCGAIGAIIPGLMEAGIDALQFDQPTLHGIDTLASYQENGNITFWCPVDIQRTLQTMDPAAIRAEANEMLSMLWRGRGGFIAGYYGDNASIGLDPKWQQIACDTFLASGVASAMQTSAG